MIIQNSTSSVNGYDRPAAVKDMHIEKNEKNMSADTAAELSISAKIQKAADTEYDSSISAAQADKMIAEANANIYNNYNDAVLAQSNQTPQMVMSLLEAEVA